MNEEYYKNYMQGVYDVFIYLVEKGILDADFAIHEISQFNEKNIHYNEEEIV